MPRLKLAVAGFHSHGSLGFDLHDRIEHPVCDFPLAHFRNALGAGVSQDGDPIALGEDRSEEHTSELQSHLNLVCLLLLEKKKRPMIPSSAQHASSHQHTSHSH